MVGAEAHQLSVVVIHRTKLRPAQLHGALHDDGENRLDIRGRAADGPEDLGCGSLPVQRLADLGMGLSERAIPCLQLSKEADVLDRNDGLVGEGLEERDLLVRKRIHLSPAEQERADRHPLPKQRSGQDRTVALQLGVGCGFRKPLRLGLGISKVDHPLLEHGAA
jgi:hypothetical protein